MEFRKVIGLLAVCTGLSFTAQAQDAPSADSVLEIVLHALVEDEHRLFGNVDSLLESGPWEALAYWNMEDSPTAESVHEAVGDRYIFSGNRFEILFVNPMDPSRFGATAEGNYKREGPFLRLFQEGSDVQEQLEIRYIDVNYLVLEVDGMRLFLTHELSYGVEN